MRVGASLLLVASVIAAPPVAARPGLSARVRPARSVQIIAMGSRPPAATVEPDDPVSASQAPMAAETDNFRIHDLSRRWVEFQMAQQLASSGSASEPTGSGAGDPFAPQVKARLDDPIGTLRPAPAIPGWMQSGIPATAATMAFAPGCDPRPYRPTGFLGLGAEARRQVYYGMMSRIACEYGLPIGLFDAMIIRESRYEPSIVSPKNAFGLTQLMPGTAQSLGVDRHDVVQNLRGGASYLRRQLDRFGQVHLALAAYNAGPGRVRDAVPAIAETRAYVDDILRNWSRLSGFEQAAAARRVAADVVDMRATPTRSATLVAFR